MSLKGLPKLTSEVLLFILRVFLEFEEALGGLVMGVMVGIFFLGQVPIPPKVLIFGFAVLAAFPLASLGIIAYAIIAELAEKDRMVTNQQQEAMYLAVRNLAIKIGQTLGVAIFVFLILLGKDLDN